MKFEYQLDRVIMTDFDSFCISEILECGQTFRFRKIESDACEYEIVAFSRVLRIKQTTDSVIFYDTDEKEFNNIWYKYFDLGRNYAYIKEEIQKNDEILQEAIRFAPGIRLLQQDSWEMLISFIISQNNSIHNIKRVIENISNKYGKQINDKYYAFPTPQELSTATVSELMECRCGYRAEYIINAVRIVLEGGFNLSPEEDTEILCCKLLAIKGIGQKVADCVLLFGFMRYDCFPADVWVKRIMSRYYFNNAKTDIKTIHKYAKSKYGNFSGFAQQYLFHYVRSMPK